MAHTVSQLNNEGAAFIENRSFTQAITKFQGAIELLKEITSNSDGEHNDEDNNMGNVFNQEYIPITTMVPRSFHDPAGSEFQPLLMSSTVAMLADPILISTSSAARSNQCPHALSCIILFNRALATHLQALELPSSAQQVRKLRLASQAYSMSNDLIPEDMNSMDMRSSTMMTLATLNNICHIYHDLGEHDEGLQYYCNLQVSAQWLHGFADSMGLEDLWSIVHVNTMLLYPPNCAASA